VNTNAKLTAEHLKRRAIVYIRQSSPIQVSNNLESQRRQYALADQARQLGFQQVEVIDEDLGRSGSGQVERPGFARLVAEVCTGGVGAVFCVEASRLARNGRDWHHLIELCGLVRALVVDPDGIYDPGLLNDRLLLGLKGTMSEFELNLLRQRCQEAIRQKARRGELQFALPVGYRWTSNGKVEMDPDRRIQQAIELVFSKMAELGSARQVLLWFRGERVSLPALMYGESGRELVWKLPVYNTIWHLLRNPMYAGAYAFGKTEARTRVVAGRARKTIGHSKSLDNWTVLIRDHHPGYITWQQFERNQMLLADNAHMKSRMEPKAGRGGRSLLAGLLRCRRCGRMLHVAYSGKRPGVPRYHCRGAHLNHGVAWCISFGGLRPDQAIAAEVLKAVEGNAVDAAVEAAARIADQRSRQRRALVLELEQAQYETRLAARRYEAVDPDNRLVAAELESRWNAALRKASEVEDRLRDIDTASQGSAKIPDKETLLSLAQDLPAVWNAETTDMRLKQRITRILIQEIVADVDESTNEIVMMIHWAGGRHSELRVKKNLTGHHSRRTSLEAIDIIRQMAGRFPDDQIAATLNRLGLKTGSGNNWVELRVRTARNYHELPSYDLKLRQNLLTLEEASERLGVSHKIVRRLIDSKIITASQVVPMAPWEIPAEAIESEQVAREIAAVKRGARVKEKYSKTELPMFAGICEEGDGCPSAQNPAGNVQ
jgi:DNA invertase Pin-like site-specific DNA recombinase